MRPKIILPILAAAAVLALLYYVYGGGNEPPSGQRPLVQLNPGNFSTLQKEFNDASNSVRVIVLLSPT